MAIATIGERSRFGSYNTIAGLAVGAIAIGALLLRLQGLDAQSLWLDEGISVHYARMGPEKIWELSFGAEPNPPLYFLALWGWLQLWGQSEVAIRSLSALAGTLCVLPAYSLGRSAGGLRAGLLAALATATSPYLLWYSQEARAFAVLALLSAILIYLSHRAALSPDRRTLALWAIGATLVLYTHVYGAFVFAACAVWQFFATAGWRMQAGLAVLAPTLLYLPWLSATLAHNNPAENWRPSVTALDVFGRSMLAVAHNGALTEQGSIWAAGLLGVAAVVGFVAARPGPGLLLALAVAVPLAASYVVSLKDPIFTERYVIPIAVPLYVAAGAGIAFMSRRLRGLEAVAGVAMVALTMQGVQAQQQASFAKENFRAAAERVAESALEDDVVLFIADYTIAPFEYYYSGPARLVGFTGDPANPEPFVEALADEAKTLWLLESHAEFVDPEHRVRQWLQQRFPIATEAYPQGIHLRAFQVKYALNGVPQGAKPLEVVFGPLRLAGAELPNTVVARDSELHPPSGWLPVTLYWQAVESASTDYRPLLQLVDPKGVWAVDLRREGDLFGKFPTSRWPVGRTMVGSSDLVLNPAMPAGRYELQLAVVDPSGQPVGGNDAQGQPLGGPLSLGQVEVVSAGSR